MIYVMNASTLGISEYHGSDPLSLVVLGESVYVLTSGVLFEQAGGSDDGAAIDAYVESGDVDFGEQERRKFCGEARVYGRAPNGIVVTTGTAEHGDRVSRGYSVPVVGGGEVGARRVKLGRGVRAVAWSFRIGNRNGGAFELDGFSVAPKVEKAAR